MAEAPRLDSTIRRCPVCRKLIEPGKATGNGVFCSKRCQSVDLARWFNGAYAIPVESDAADPESPRDAQDE